VFYRRTDLDMIRELDMMKKGTVRTIKYVEPVIPSYTLSMHIYYMDLSIVQSGQNHFWRKISKICTSTDWIGNSEDYGVDGWYAADLCQHSCCLVSFDPCQQAVNWKINQKCQLYKMYYVIYIKVLDVLYQSLNVNDYVEGKVL
jgi:hypothetical protein